MSRFENLPAALQANLRDDRHLILIDGENESRRLSFRQLQQRALGLLGALQRRGLGAGDAVILFVSDNQSFLEMFWACVLGGLVPVPLTVGAGDEHRRKLFRIFAKFGRAWVYSEARTLERIEGFADAQDLAAVARELQARTLLAGTLDAGGAPGRSVAPMPDDIAFIQFSSGSTSEPKGVVLTHRNLTANIASIIEASGITADDVALSWMPLSHDMGLIGFHLAQLSAGASHAIMRTDLFARRPLLWLKCATELRATLLCSPNFGYQHYLKQYALRRPDGLDLSAVRLIYNGAEPIAAELCERFLRTLAPHGLKANSMFTVYGLAEASLAVSFPVPGEPLRVLHLDRNAMHLGEAVQRVPADAPQAASFVKLGRPVPGTELRIADDAGAALAEMHLGRVLIRGDNVTRGYFHDDAATARAQVGDGWLDTGDLGCIVDGELVITGRAKDIIFVNGQNWYPHDLEKLAEQLPGIETNKVAVAGVRNPDTGSEDVAVFVLHRGGLAEFAPLAREIRRILSRQTGLDIAYVLPVPRLPKTTSGKLQRHQLARAFAQNEFVEAIAALRPLLDEPAGVPTAPVVGTAQRLCEICAPLLDGKPLTATTDLFDLNLNSLTLARIHEAIDREFPGRLEVTDLFDHPTLEALAAYLDKQAA